MSRTTSKAAGRFRNGIVFEEAFMRTAPATHQWPSTPAGTVSGTEQILGELMRIEGYHVVILLVMVLTVAAVVVGVTLLVRWAVRLGRKRKGDGGAGAPRS